VQHVGKQILPAAPILEVGYHPFRPISVDAADSSLNHARLVVVVLKLPFYFFCFFPSSTLTATQHLHLEVKYDGGYPRVIGPAALVLARLVRGLTPMNNTPALVCLIVTLAADRIENLFVRFPILPDPPETYDQRALHRFADPDDTRHIHMVEESEASNSQKIAIRLRCLRELPFLLHGFFMAPAVLFSIDLLQLLLGASHISYPFCSPFLSSKDIMGDNAGQIFVWEHPLRCFKKLD
jgi:hypothetical protein